MNSSAPLLADLIVAAHRLTRIAARSTGNTTPSAVWNTLSILSTDGPLRIGELASAARVTQPSMTKVVHQLVDEGLVERVADADDSRAWLVTVTAAGLRALDDWRNALTAALEPMFSGLTAADLAALARAVDILTARTATGRAAA
ncbi:MarR family transcriptional regulator [Leifsonia bigeumensis]|uniref:MarR family transcriptional regulator n=1 Tax=Leifsonella bigeumensis TaxID=433643 RepID=A0ABP7FIU4_9MICO